MASRPDDELPESIVIDTFSGIKNTVSPERLQPGELESAVNVDLDDVGQARRRRGVTLIDAANYHSLQDFPSGRMLVVKNGDLGLLNPAYDFYPLATVGPNELGYTEVGETIYYSSSDHSGKILSNNTREDWGTRDGSTIWQSPVIRPTDTLGPVAGKILGPPPQALILESWRGRIFMAHGPVLWATELFLFDHVDKTRNYIQFETDITLMAAVDDGIYVGTTQALYFLSGQFSKGLARKHVVNSPVLRGSAVRVPTSQVKAALERGGELDEAVMLMSEAGVLACLGGGIVVNATDGKTVFPGADSAAALHREDSGVSTYVSVTRSGGGPSTNARIGDYVEAEIRRPQGS